MQDGKARELSTGNVKPCPFFRLKLQKAQEDESQVSLENMWVHIAILSFFGSFIQKRTN